MEVRLRPSVLGGVPVTRIRDIAGEARRMDRFTFIANFVAGATRTKEQREPVLGMQEGAPMSVERLEGRISMSVR